MTPKKKSGRPRKPESEKVQYQRIAVYLEDYNKLIKELEKNGIQLVDAFTAMVQLYKDRV